MLVSEAITERGFYRFGSRKGLRPVHLWVGRIDGPDELAGMSNEPVVSTILQSMREGMPRLGHAPFYMSALLAEPFEKVRPFDLEGQNFDAKYLEWRREWDAGDGGAWEVGPAEVYFNAIKTLMGKGKQ